MVKDTGDKLGSADKAAIESAIEAVKKAIEGTDAAEITRTLDQLTAAQHKAAESLYKQQAAGGAPGPTGPATDQGPAGGASSGTRKPEGDVIDAEVVDEGKS